MVCANIDATKINGIKPSKVLVINGTKIGIVGYYTPHSDDEFDIEFKTEIKGLRREAKILRKDGVNVIIALGHSGQNSETIFAKNIRAVDIFVSSHSMHEYTQETGQIYPMWVWEGNSRIFKHFEIFRYLQYKHITRFNLQVNTTSGYIQSATVLSIKEFENTVRETSLEVDKGDPVNFSHVGLSILSNFILHLTKTYF